MNHIPDLAIDDSVDEGERLVREGRAKEYLICPTSDEPDKVLPFLAKFWAKVAEIHKRSNNEI